MPCLHLRLCSIVVTGLFVSFECAGAIEVKKRINAQPPAAVWAGGTGLWSDESNWLNGGPAIGPHTSVYIDNSNPTLSTANLDGYADIANLTIDGSDALHILDGFSLTVGSDGPGVINLLGDLRLNGSADDCNLIISCGGSVEVQGSGVIDLTDSFGSAIMGGAPGSGCDEATMINRSTIHGAGQVGAGTLQIYNEGLIDANRALELITLTPRPGIGGVVNSGLMQASQGGNLRLVQGEFDNAMGVIRADEYSHVDLIGAKVSGGTLETSGNGVIRSHAIGATLQNVTLNGRFELGVVRLTLLEQFTNNGVIDFVSNNSLDGVGEFTEVILPPGSGNVTVKGSGEIRMVWGEFHSGSASAGGHLINDATHTIRGAGYIGNNTLGVTNRGVMISDRDVPFVIDPINSQMMVNSGTLRSSGTGGLVLTGGTFRNDGVIEALPGARCVFTGLASIANISGSSLVGGTWKVIAGNQTAMFLTSAPSLFYNAADVTLSGPGSSFWNIHSIANNSGRFTLDDRRQFVAANTFFSNDGYFSVRNGSKFTVNGSFMQSAGAETHVHLDAAFVTPGWTAVKATSTAALDGTLRVTAATNLNLLAGQTIKLMSAANFTGGFQNIIAPPGVQISIQGGSVNAVISGCAWDLNGNGLVGADDILIIMLQWGVCPVGGSCMGDLNQDGQVNSSDITILMSHWGPCFP